MSLATLKKKSQTLYNNLSVGVDGFSLNGTHRSGGYIGQSTQSRHLTRTLMKGNVVKGSGGCCGAYVVTNVKPSELACLNDPMVVKPAVMNNAGMLHTKYKWFWSGRNSVKPDSNQHKIQSDHTTSLAKQTVQCANDSYEVPAPKTVNCDTLPALARPRTNGLMTGTIRHRAICPTSKPETNFVAMSYEQYLQQVDAACTANDPVATTYNCNCPLPGPATSL
jgi:hypothetical protein